MVLPADIIGLEVARVPHPRGGGRKARKFYVEALGLVECERPSGAKGRGGIWLTVGHAWLHLVPEEDFRPCRDAFPALLAGSACAVADRLERLGHTVKRGKGSDGRCHILLEDPFGNMLEITEDGGADAREFIR